MMRRVIQGPYRVGPWPGLTGSGALVLLLCATAVGAFETAFDWRSLPVLAITALAPMAVATRVLNTPGAATAVCGAYLLPRALLALVIPTVALPPFLLVPAFAFDFALWLGWSDLKRRKRKQRMAREVTWPRAAIGGALFGLVLSAVQPTFELLPSLGTMAVSAVVGLASVRGTAR